MSSYKTQLHYVVLRSGCHPAMFHLCNPLSGSLSSTHQPVGVTGAACALLSAGNLSAPVRANNSRCTHDHVQCGLLVWAYTAPGMAATQLLGAIGHSAWLLRLVLGWMLKQMIDQRQQPLWWAWPDIVFEPLQRQQYRCVGFQSPKLGLHGCRGSIQIMLQCVQAMHLASPLR